MKAQFLSLFIPLFLLLPLHSKAADFITKYPGGTTEAFADPWLCLIERCENIFAGMQTTTQTSATSTTVLLLKEAEAAQPDALNYVAGAAPSPVLYDVVEKLQTFTFEEAGLEMSFDEVVDMIISLI